MCTEAGNLSGLVDGNMRAPTPCRFCHVFSQQQDMPEGGAWRIVKQRHERRIDV